MIDFRQGTANQPRLFGAFVNSTDTVPNTSLMILNTDIKIMKPGASTEVSKDSGGATHVAQGRYVAVFNAADTDTVGTGEINIAMSGTLPIRRPFRVLSPAVYDQLYGPDPIADLTAVESKLDSIANQLTLVITGVMADGFVAPDQNVTAEFTVSTVPDALPTAIVYKKAVDGSFAPAPGVTPQVFVVPGTSDLAYRVQAPIPADATPGDAYTALLSVVVSSETRVYWVEIGTVSHSWEWDQQLTSIQTTVTVTGNTVTSMQSDVEDIEDILAGNLLPDLPGTVVDHNWGGVDEYRVLDQATQAPINGAQIRFYLASDWSNPAHRGRPWIKAAVTTGPDGRWTSAVTLPPESYKLLILAANRPPILADMTVT